jgi:hypothetical protein
MKYIILLFLIACQSEQKPKENLKGVKTLYAPDPADSMSMSTVKCDTVYIYDTVVVYKTKYYKHVENLTIGDD